MALLSTKESYGKKLISTWQRNQQESILALMSIEIWTNEKISRWTKTKEKISRWNKTEEKTCRWTKTQKKTCRWTKTKGKTCRWIKTKVKTCRWTKTEEKTCWWTEQLRTDATDYEFWNQSKLINFCHHFFSTLEHDT